MSFGMTLRQAREAQGWTQPELARAIYDASAGRIDLTPAEISRYERGRVRNPRIDVIRAAAKATGQPVELFTNGSEEAAGQADAFRRAHPGATPGRGRTRRTPDGGVK